MGLGLLGIQERGEPALEVTWDKVFLGAVELKPELSAGDRAVELQPLLSWLCISLAWNVQDVLLLLKLVRVSHLLSPEAAALTCTFGLVVFSSHA